jgi:hypothetical protein
LEDIIDKFINMGTTVNLKCLCLPLELLGIYNFLPD